MTTSHVFNASSSVQDIRDVFSGMTLEIMGYFFPSDAVKDLLQKYEDTPGGPEELKDMPSGAAAVDFDAVSPATKSALLTAQAAERTVRLAEQAATLSDNHDELVSSGNAPDFDQSGGKALYHDDFKWVGSENDPAHLQKAQGTMMAAQAYLNNEIKAVDDAINSPEYPGRRYSRGAEAVDGFRQAAATSYEAAAEALAAEGHEKEAAKVREAGRTIGNSVENENAPTPYQTVWNIEWQYGRGNQDMDMMGLHPATDEGFEQAMEKIKGLVAGPAQSGQDPQPKGPGAA